MRKPSQNLTRLEAIDLLKEFKVIKSSLEVGANARGSIELPAGGIDPQASGLFRRADVLLLVIYAKDFF